MPRGGARANSGPPPDPSSRRQQTKAQASGWIDLPAEGRPGDPPAWPFATELPGEAEAWSVLWSKPQAVAWEATAVDLRVVAMYVRRSIEAEADVKASSEARQIGALLGLDPASMLRNRWRVKSDEVAEKRATKAAPAKRRALKVADDAVGG